MYLFLHGTRLININYSNEFRAYTRLAWHKIASWQVVENQNSDIFF